MPDGIPLTAANNREAFRQRVEACLVDAVSAVRARILSAFDRTPTAQDLAALSRCIGALPPEQRSAFTLQYVNGLPASVTAARLGIDAVLLERRIAAARRAQIRRVASWQDSHRSVPMQAKRPRCVGDAADCARQGGYA